jgi:hypothetical protein
MRKGYVIKFDANGPFIEMADQKGNTQRFSVSEFKEYLDKSEMVSDQEVPEFYLKLQNAMKEEEGDGRHRPPGGEGGVK